MLTITRNPFGFKNKIKDRTGYHGVSNTKKNEVGETIMDTDFVSDDAFKKHVLAILKNNDIEILPQGIKVKNFKALPDDFDLFKGEYIDSITNEVKNMDSLKRRIIGLSSYFRSAQEGLLPKFNKTPEDYHIFNIPMSNFQFKIYEDARKEERKTEKPMKAKSGGQDDIYKEPSSTYRIFSRLYCNYVMPSRPLPRDFRDKKEEEEVEERVDEKEQEESKKEKVGLLGTLLKEAKKAEGNQDISDDYEGEVEGDEVLNKIGGITYNQKIEEIKERLTRASVLYPEEHRRGLEELANKKV
jgi:hypothetical protein